MSERNDGGSFGGGDGGDILDGALLWVGIGAALALMVTGAASERAALSYAGGGLFLATVLVVGGGLLRSASQSGDREASSLSFARLIAAVWAWCGLAMLASYYLTNLSWQHAWQYGAAMALIGAGVLVYARKREAPGSRLSEAGPAGLMRWITALQGVAALVGVAALIYSGKVETHGRDWAANVIFVAGGLAIFALSAMAVLAERPRRAQTPSPQ